MTREIRYALMDPAGNRTILVTTPVLEALQPQVAAALMKLEPSAEQTGFLSVSAEGVRLRMAGGEFCGNAAMSAAVYARMGTEQGGGTVPVRVSGVPEPVPVELTALPEGQWQGSVEMPRPDDVRQVRFPEGQILPVVSFPGISHVILE